MTRPSTQLTPILSQICEIPITFNEVITLQKKKKRSVSFLPCSVEGLQARMHLYEVIVFEGKLK